MTASIVGLDLGSAKLGAVAAFAGLPLRVIGAQTLPVDRHSLAPTADHLRAEVDALAAACGEVPEIVIEFGALYIPKDASPQAARAMAANHETMSTLLLLIWQAMPGPVYRTATIARRSWSSRVVPHTQGGVTTAASNAGLAAYLDPAGNWIELADQHRRDAVGAIVGWLLGAPVRESRPWKAGRIRKRYKPKPRPPSPRALAKRAQDAAADALLEAAQARVAAVVLPLPRYVEPLRPCGCGQRGPHRDGCAIGPK